MFARNDLFSDTPTNKDGAIKTDQHGNLSLGGDGDNDSAKVSASARRAKMEEQKKMALQKRKKNMSSGGMLRTQSESARSKAALGEREPITPKERGPRTPRTPKTAGSTGGFMSEGVITGRTGGGGADAPPPYGMSDKGIAGTFDPGAQPVVTESKLDTSDLRAFLNKSLPEGTHAQCYVLRNKTGFTGKMYPNYDLYLQDGNVFLLSARKRKKNKSSNYVISMNKKVQHKDSAQYMGKLRSNFIGTEFNIYDKGVNPDRVKGGAAGSNLLSLRQELGLVLYESNLLGSRGPRKMTVLVPKANKDGERTMIRPQSGEGGLSEKLKSENFSDCTPLVNKSPKWNDEVGAYVLNFNGRVTLASVKNFQLCDKDNEDNVILQFGRVAKDTFTMDFTHPLSPLQAYAICLSSFDYKLACE